VQTVPLVAPGTKPTQVQPVIGGNSTLAARTTKHMAWRVHLTNQAIRQLHILPSKPAMLAAWTQRNRVQFYNLENGTLLEERTIPDAPTAPRQSQPWQDYIASLTQSQASYFLPYIRTRQTDIYTTDDGKLRLYRLQDGRVFMETDGAEQELREARQFITLDLDRALGTVVGLDEACKLHIYQQDLYIGAFDIGLEVDPDLRPALVISRGTNNIYATDGKRLVAVDTNGSVQKTLQTHYFVGRLAASSGGNMVITSDMESGVLRVYHGNGLVLTHQRFAIDLVAEANQVQLLADLPPVSTAISALAAYTRGILAFAMSGVVCVTDVQHMDEIPRPKALL
jgi:hypothetical protein